MILLMKSRENFRMQIHQKSSKIDEFGRVVVRLIRDRGKYHLLFNSDGEVNEKLPKTIIKALGTPAEDIIITKEKKSRGARKK